MNKILVIVIVSTLVAACSCSNGLTKSQLELRQMSGVNCTDADYKELVRLTEEFNSCKSSICRADQTGCSCCSGRSDACCNAFGAGLELYRICKDYIGSKTNNKKQATEIQVIISLYNLCRSIIDDVRSTAAAATVPATFGSIFFIWIMFLLSIAF